MRIWCLLALIATLAVAEDRQPAGNESDPGIDPKEVAKRLASKDVTERLEAAREAANVQDSCVVTPLTRLLKDKEMAVREAALSALKLREDEKDKKKAATAIAARLKPLAGKEEWKSELIECCNALHDLAQRSTIKALLTNVSTETSPDELRARLRAVANVPHAEAIDELLRFASSGRKANRRSKWAQQAMAYATCQKDDKSLDQWRRWWTDNKKTFDFEGAYLQRQQERAEAATKAEQRKNRKNRKKRKGLEEE